MTDLYAAAVAPGLGFNLIATALLILAAMLALWWIGTQRNDVSIVDIFWGPGFGLVALATWLLAGGEASRMNLVTLLTLIWAARLGLHIGARNLARGEDPRYSALRHHVQGNFNRYALTHVFLLQGLLMWVISLPLQLAQYLGLPDSLGIAAWSGAALWLAGFLFEAIGDAQLARFKADPANRGRLMDRGLRRYTRHPNYFGDACVWWGLFLIACDHVLGVATVISPILMTWLLVSYTGKALLERCMSRRNPAYALYAARTSGFFPWPPRRG